MDEKHEKRIRRHRRVRKRVSGDSARPRLNVFRSLSHIYAQIIDDDAATTLVSASSAEKELQSLGSGGNLKAVSGR